MTESPTARRGFTDGDVLPAWFSSALYAVLVWCATAGTIALFLLWHDWYHASTCSLLATAATVAAWHFRPRPAAGAQAAHGPAIAAVAIALVLLAFAGAAHSEHLFTDRDPAVYINTGRSIARTDRLDPKIAPGPFDNKTSFAFSSAGFWVTKHRLHSNFLAFLPALLALGWSVGGDTGLLLLPALLGALALLAVYALGSTVVGPRWALLPPAILTLAPLQSWFARDAYTELPLQLLALGGIWLFIEARRGGGAVAGAIAGVVLGSITFVRIDALTVLVAVPAALVVEHLRAASLERASRSRRRAAIWSFAAALGATGFAGLIVSRALSPSYLFALRSQLHELKLTLVAGVIVALGIGQVHRLRRGLGRRFARNEIVFWSGAGLTFAVALYAYVWRPRSTRPAPSTTLSRVAAARRLHAFFYSYSFRWFSWYLGIFTLVLAVIGLVVLARRALRADGPVSLVVAAIGPVTLLYIARPSISPDHLWAMRRYLPVVLPGMTIAAAAAAVWVISTIAARQPRVRAPLVVVFAAAMIVPPAIAGLPLAGAQMQGGALDAIHTLCAVAGTKAAIAVEPYGFQGAELPQTLRGFCGVPVARLVTDQPTPLATFAREWKDRGDRFYVVTSAATAVTNTTPDAVEVAHVLVADAREPERIGSRAPHKYLPRPVDLRMYRINPS